MPGSNVKQICPVVQLAVVAVWLMVSGCVQTSIDGAEKWGPEQRAEAHVRLGLIYLQQGRFDTAATEFDAAISINSKSDTAHHAKALLLSQLGLTDEATRHFLRAVSLDPGNYLAVNDYGIHLCQQGRVAEGIAQLQRIEGAIDNGNLPGTQLGLGICHSLNHDAEPAEHYLRLALERSPSLPQALFPMAEISYQQEKFLAGRAFMERYFATGIRSDRSLHLAALIEYALGDLDKANQYRRALKNRFPDSEMNAQLETLLGAWK